MGKLFDALGSPAPYSAIVGDAVAGAVSVARLPTAMRNQGFVMCEGAVAGSGTQGTGTGTVTTPVLLLHGYGSTDAAWQPVVRRLSGAGVTDLRLARYDAFRLSVADVASRLVDLAYAAMEDAGSRAVHLVGHSLGGLVARYAVQCRGLDHHAVTVATIATPHRGSRFAHIGWGASAADLRPGSAALAELESALPSTAVRWVTYYSTADLVAPPSTAMLCNPAFDATNVHVPNVGHLSIVRSPMLADSLVDQLLLSEQRFTEAPALVRQAELSLAACRSVA